MPGRLFSRPPGGFVASLVGFGNPEGPTHCGSSTNETHHPMPGLVDAHADPPPALQAGAKAEAAPVLAALASLLHIIINKEKEKKRRRTLCSTH
jgi:hypothetical protein